MNPLKIVAILLIIGGTLGLTYGGFNYTKETHRADIGPLHINLNEKEQVNIPPWASIGSIIGGVLLLAAPRK